MYQIEMEDGGIIKIELVPQLAPITCENFRKLVNQHYYDGLIFHRVIKGFMIQGGWGPEVPCIKGEFDANGIQNIIRHSRGVISMARTNVMDSASSQFFICHANCDFLNGNYASFGYVVEGMDVVDRIANVQTVNDKPVQEQRIKTIKEIY